MPQFASAANPSIPECCPQFLRHNGDWQFGPERPQYHPEFFLVRHSKNVRAGFAEPEMLYVVHIAADFTAATSGDSCGGEF